MMIADSESAPILAIDRIPERRDHRRSAAVNGYTSALEKPGLPRRFQGYQALEEHDGRARCSLVGQVAGNDAVATHGW